MPAHRIPLQRLLHHQRQTWKAFGHVRMAGCQPDLHTSRDRDHRRPSTQSRMRPSASVSISLSTRTRRPRSQLDRHIARLPAALRWGWRFRGNGSDCRRGLRYDHGHQVVRRRVPRFIDLAKPLAPPKELADVDVGRSRNLGEPPQAQSRLPPASTCPPETSADGARQT